MINIEFTLHSKVLINELDNMHNLVCLVITIDLTSQYDKHIYVQIACRCINMFVGMKSHYVVSRKIHLLGYLYYTCIYI